MSAPVLLENDSSFTIPSVSVESKLPKNPRPNEVPTEQIYTKMIWPKGAKRNFQIARPQRAALSQLPMILEVQGTYVDESGQVALYDNMRDIKVILRCHKTDGLARLVEMQERLYGDVLASLTALRPQPATALQWTSVPFIQDLGNGFIDVTIKFPPTMQVRVINSQNLDAEAFHKPIFQCSVGDRVGAAPFQLTKPWSMADRTARDGSPLPPIFGLTAKSVSGTGGSSDEEVSRGMVTIIENVPGNDEVSAAGAGIEDAAQPTPAKRRKGVQADLGDL